MRMLTGAAEPRTPEWDSVLPPWTGTLRWRLETAGKTVMDLVGALVGLAVLSPLFLLIAVAIKIDSPGPVFHPMEWMGYRGRRFRGYKFRTMVRDAEELKQELMAFNEMSGPVFKMAEDPRITRVGRFLRRTSLDELPQFYSVLCGDMSLVGPRPPGPHEYAEFKPHHKLKLAVLPGITCLWQVSGRSSISDFDEWIKLDMQYIREWSLVLDIKLLFATIPAVVSARGAK